MSAMSDMFDYWAKVNAERPEPPKPTGPCQHLTDDLGWPLRTDCDRCAKVRDYRAAEFYRFAAEGLDADKDQWPVGEIDPEADRSLP